MIFFLSLPQVFIFQFINFSPPSTFHLKVYQHLQIQENQHLQLQFNQHLQLQDNQHLYTASQQSVNPYLPIAPPRPRPRFALIIVRRINLKKHENPSFKMPFFQSTVESTYPCNLVNLSKKKTENLSSPR